MSEPKTPEVLSVSETAALLGVSATTVRRKIKRGELVTAHRSGHGICVNAECVTRLISATAKPAAVEGATVALESIEHKSERSSYMPSQLLRVVEVDTRHRVDRSSHRLLRTMYQAVASDEAARGRVQTRIARVLAQILSDLGSDK